jgi:hypothetical protein
MDLDAYRTEAEKFLGALDREYYLHYSGRQDEYGIEAVYERHENLFSREAVEGLRDAGARALLEFAVHGLIGRETKAEAAELARREAMLEVVVNGNTMTFRETSLAQANEVDPALRLAIERARNDAVEEHLNPLLRQLTERGHAIAAELGWANTVEMCEDLSGIDLRALGRQAGELLDHTEDGYRSSVGPELEQHLGIGFDELRRADLAAFFRASSLDVWFPTSQLVPSLIETLAGMGIDIEAQPSVTLDTEHRPKKSPRAFCAPVRVPDEVYLVIARIGGREDYAALFHEAGHTEHYAHVDGTLPMEHRYLGDNSVTEGFAFLLEDLTEDPNWLERMLGLSDPGEVVRHAAAVKLMFLRRYCAKLAYELELHGGRRSLDGLSERYSKLLGDAVGVEWSGATWLSDVDPFFYASRYLRAWALETHLATELRNRWGPAWFEEPEAGDFLRGLWRHGQALNADELLEQLVGARLELAAVG